MIRQREKSPQAPLRAEVAAPHIARVFDTGEALLLRAKQIAQEVEERVRHVLQDEQHPTRGPHR